MRLLKEAAGSLREAPHIKRAGLKAFVRQNAPGLFV